MIFAILGICLAFRDEPAWAVICLILSGCCDMFDGTVARSCTHRTETEKQYGVQIDSLADTVSFLILPVAICLGMGHGHPVSVAAYALFILTGLIRLGCFNVLASGSEVKIYTGLPVTTIAGIMPILWLIHVYTDTVWTEALFDGILFLTSVLFISRLRIPKPGKAVMAALAAAAFIAIVVILDLELSRSRIGSARRTSWKANTCTIRGQDPQPRPRCILEAARRLRGP